MKDKFTTEGKTMKDRKCECGHFESMHTAEDRNGYIGSGECKHERCDCLEFEILKFITLFIHPSKVA